MVVYMVIVQEEEGAGVPSRLPVVSMLLPHLGEAVEEESILDIPLLLLLVTLVVCAVVVSLAVQKQML
jgi:hypothetical protein